MEINCKYCPKNDGTGNCLINGCPLPPVIKEIEEMQSFLEITASDNPKELIDRLTDINVYLARSGKLLADAKAYQDIPSALPAILYRRQMISFLYPFSSCLLFDNQFVIYIVKLTFCYGITINIFLNINNLNVIYQ